MVQFRRSVSLTGASDKHKQVLADMFGTGRSDSGERVNVDTVWALPAFLRGVTYITDRLASCPIHVKKNNTNGAGSTKDKSHFLYDALSYKPNPLKSIDQWVQTIVANCLWSGDGYARILREGNRVYLYNLDSRGVTPVEEYYEGMLVGLWYAIEDGGGNSLIVPAEDVIHIKNLSIHNGVQGISIVDKCRTVLGLALAVQRYGAVFFKNGTHMNRWVMVPEWCTQDQKNQILQAIELYKSGLDNAHRIGLLMGGANMHSEPIDNNAAQFLETRRMSIVDIANILGLPASKLNEKNSVAYNSQQQDNLSVLSDCFDAWFNKLEHELTSKLIPPSQRQSHFIEFERKALFRSDPEHVRLIIEQFNNRALSWEEMRELLGRPADRAGTFIDDFKSEAPDALQTPEQPQLPEPQNNERGTALIRSHLERIRSRLTKSGSQDMADHWSIITDSFPDIPEESIRSVLNIEELEEVLPEQRKGIIEKWNTQIMAEQLWKA